MDRREFAVLAGTALAVPRALFAQPAKRVYRIATLDDAVESARAHLWQRFRNRLRELLLAEGKDVAYEARYSNGDTERLPALAAELVALKPDIIVCAGTPSTSAAMKATSSIPIVFTGVGDPVGSRLVTSLAHPGSNATGISVISFEIRAKQIELLREISPGAIRLAYLTDVSNRATVLSFPQLEKSARTMNATIRMLDGRRRTALILHGLPIRVLARCRLRAPDFARRQACRIAG